MGAILGRIVIMEIAAGVGAVGVAKIGRGIRRTFVEDLAGSVGRVTVVIGLIGHIAKGLVLVSVGLLLLWAVSRTTRPTSEASTWPWPGFVHTLSDRWP